MKQKVEHFRIKPEQIEHLEKCPACDCKDLQEISSLSLSSGVSSDLLFLQTVYCSKCDLVFRKSRPKLSWFEEAWKQRDDFYRARNNRETSIDADFERLRYLRYANTEKAIEQITQTRGIVLDIGSGPGSGLLAFKNAGWQVLGIEPDPWRASYSKNVNNIEVFCGKLEAAPFKLKSIDVIILSHVLEHIHNPIQFLKEISKFLKPNGLLYVEVPNLTNSVSWTDAFYLEHLNNFSLNNLVQVIAKASYNPLRYWAPQTKPTGSKHLGIFARADSGNGHESHQADFSNLKTTLSFKEVLSLYRKNIPDIIKTKSLGNEKLSYTVKNITNICSCLTLSRLRVRLKTSGGDYLQIVLREAGRFDMLVKQIRKMGSIRSSVPVVKADPKFEFPSIHSFLL